MATKAIVGEKVGMTQVWDDDNRVVPVTVLRVKPCRVVQVKTDELDGYTALQVTFGTKKASKITKPKLGHFEKAGVDPGPRLVELRLDDVSDYVVGQELKADVLIGGELVDVTAVSKGKGFAGTMKRHGFGGMSASHGTHRTHRAPGSIGACATPSRVFRGQRMAGRMGNEKVTTPEPPGRAGRRRARPRPGPWLRARPQGRPRPHPRRREGRCLMPTVDTKDAKGAKAGSVELDDAMFGVQPNVPVMHQVVTAQLAAKRSGTQSTKTRAEVRGGGAKPWKQKGTGRARAGSSRSPIWTGGGVAHAPEAPRLRPAHPQEDDPPGPEVGPVRPGQLRADPRARLGPRDAQHEGRHRRPGRQRRRGPRARRPASRGHRRVEEPPEPATTSTSAASASSTPTTCW